MTMTDDDRRIIESAMQLAAERGWRGFGLSDIARETGLPLVTIYRRAPSKPMILAKLIRHIDETVLEQGCVDPSTDESPRDRLFEVLMRRFDALRPYRDGLRAVYRDLRYHPFAGGMLGIAVARSMGWMRLAAGVAGQRAPDWFASSGLTIVYASAFRVWLDDDSLDLTKTMASLDQGLRRCEGFAQPWVRRSSPTSAHTPETNSAVSQGA